MIFEGLKHKKRTVILDTDIGPDCDDVGAIAVLLSYAKEIGFPIGGICNCTSSIYGTATLDALLSYCGHPEIPLGAYSKPDFMEGESYEKYNRYIAQTFSPKFQQQSLSPMDHVAFYRSILANAADRDVIIITIGMLNCLADLLSSPPDHYSELSGKELVAQKVYAVVSMAARYPEGREFNVHCAPNSAKSVFRECPVPILLSDFILGKTVITGFDETAEESQKNNPIFQAYKLYTLHTPGKEYCKNASFDLTAVQFACEGEGELYGLGAAGYLEFYNCDPSRFPRADATRFVEQANGNIRFMTKKCSDEKLAALLQARIEQFNQ